MAAAKTKSAGSKHSLVKRLDAMPGYETAGPGTARGVKGAGIASKFGFLPDCLAFLCLALVELLTFLPILSRVGYYLDDYATVAFLHFAPHDSIVSTLYSYFINDGRVLIRPVEVLHYGLIYLLFGEGSFPFHLVNVGFEILAAFLFYLVLKRLIGSPTVALASALFFLLHPGHDSSHYWVICSSLSLSMLLFLTSFWTALKAFDSNSPGLRCLWQALSFCAFTLGLFNYETILPLCATTIMSVFALQLKQSEGPLFQRLRQAFAACLMPIVSALLGVGLLISFLKFGVPYFGKGYDHAAVLDPALMFKTIMAGLQVNLSPEPLQFFYKQAQFCLLEFSSSEKWRLAGAVAVMLLGVCALAVGSKPDSALQMNKDERASVLSPAELLFVGFLSVLASYTIFGLSHDHFPTLVTLVNRINGGANFAVSMMFSALMLLLLRSLVWMVSAHRQGANGKRAAIAVAVFSLVNAAICSFLLLADWGMAKPWMVSWQTQKHIQQKMKEAIPSLPSDACLLLINCPRYVMWAPVFDGVWDFQNLLRIVSNRTGAIGNVVSERLSITKEGLVDVSYGYECGKYPFSKLYVMVAPSGEVLRIQDADAFIDLVEARGRQFGLDDNVFSKWRKQAKAVP